METCGQIFYARLATQTTSLQGYSTAALLSWLVLTTAPSRATFSEIERNTGINTGIPVVVFSNTEIPVLPNVVGIGAFLEALILGNSNHQVILFVPLSNIVQT